MGWMRTLLLGDIGNRLDIGDTERDIAALRRKARSKSRRDADQDARIAALERENAELSVCVASLIRLLVSKGAVSEEELALFAGADDDGAAEA